MQAFGALGPDGIWYRVAARRRRPYSRYRLALFLDRDGVLVEEVAYLHRPEDVRLIPGAAAVIGRANALGVAAVVATNQSGLARGLFGWAAFAATQARIEALLAAEGADLDMTLACPFHPDGRGPFRGAHRCRKPGPGMLLRAAETLGLDLAASWVVGDRARDLAAGRAAGCAGGLHVLTGHGAGERTAAAALARPGFEVRKGASIAAAAGLPVAARGA